MNKYFKGILTGFVLASVLAIPIFTYVRTEKENFGRHQGKVHGEVLVYKFLDKHFQADERPKEYIDAYRIKDVMIYVIEKDGEKTIQTK